MLAMIFQIAINAPLHGLFDYLPPAGWSGDASVVGCRVEVIFGRGKTTGMIAGTAPDSSLPRSRLRKITRVLDQQPVMDPAMLELLMWAASYYQHPVGEVIAAALPLGLRQGRPLGGLEQVWSLTPAGAQQDPGMLARRAPRQWELWQRLEQSPGGVGETALSTLPQGWRNTLKRMLDKGWISSREEEPGTRRELVIRPGPELTTDQSRAAALITGATGFSPFLLFGVTGSGKTEVYFEAMEQVLAAGRQVLFLVPEIGLTPQLLERVRNRFDGNLAILHSGLSDGERMTSWRDAASGAAHIIIGTRSAALAPMARPGMIIVDEEHDPSFKQWEGFRYSARDMAVARARRHDSPGLGNAVARVPVQRAQGKVHPAGFARAPGCSQSPGNSSCGPACPCLRRGLVDTPGAGG
jgi:primosomal protein N' (replication factor Y)